jgi:ADP-dependent phosphofructokinase/glucokinase
VRTLFPVASSVGFNEEELGALFSALGGGYDDLPRKQCDPQRDAEAKRHRILRWNIVKRAIKLLQLESLLDELDPPEVPPCLLGKSPDVAAVSAALDYVFRAAHAQGSSVSRLHFHSLGFHIIATARRGITGTGTNTGADGGGSAGHLPLREWPNVLQAAASGALAATYQACNVSGHEDLHGDDLELVVPTKLDVHATGDDVRSLGKEEALHLWQTAYLDVAFSPVLVCKKPLVTVGLGDAISAKALAAHF